MHIMRMYDKASNSTIGLFYSIQLAMDCVKLSWAAYPEASFTISIDGITVERKGFDKVEYGFEPMRVITAIEHL